MKRILYIVLKTSFYFSLFLFCLAVSAWLTISFTVKKDVVKNPDLKGMLLIDAESLVQSRGLKFVELERKFDESLEEDRIIDQNPAPDLKMKRGQTVEVTVSRGMEQVTVPSLVGHTRKKAEILLEHAKFSIGKIYRVYSEHIEENAVIAQEPPAMVKRSPETKISLVVSRGNAPEYYIMPELAGLSQEMSRRVLSRIGINNFNIRHTSSEFAKDSVLSQIPAAGRRVRLGDIITLTLAGD